MRFCTTLAALGVATIVAASTAGAQTQIFGSGAAGPNFFNPQGANAGVRVYNNCFVELPPSATQAEITEARLTLFRLANAPAVNIELFAVEMTFDGTAFNIGTQTSLGVVSLPEQGAAGNFTINAIPASPVTLTLETVSNPGLGGFWIAWNEVSGAVGTNQQGARTAGAPAIGASINGFGMFNFNGSGIFEAFFGFGAGVPARFMVDVFGSVVGGSSCVGPTPNYFEPEPCGDDFNGGCNSPPFTPVDIISPNQIIAGTFWADADTRDTDWYEFTTTEPTNLTVEIYSDGPGAAILVDAICPPTVIAVTGFGCPGVLTFDCLPAGTYRIVALMTVFNGFPCGSGDVNEYTLVVSNEPAECDPICGAGQDCCEVSETPGCSDEICCDLVCSVDSFCCLIAWDFLCTQLAADFCGLPCPGICELSGNDCCAAATTPGCSDPTCCEFICLLDPFCCDTAWDQLCADQALEFCETCTPPECPFTCTGTAEGEPCGEDTNGGCNSVFPVFGVVNCNETICGTAWASGGTRDTDWYVLDLADETEITVTITSQLPMVIGIVNTTDCATATELNPFAAGDFCGTATFTVTLPAGTHWVFAAPAVFNGFPCGSGNNDYALTVSCASGPVCTENPDQSGDGCVSGADIAIVLGNWNPTTPGTPGSPGDVNCDGLVSGADIAVILGAWLTGPNCP
ncbi:MAG: hypothetical protein KF724_03125 [Phycisphaeraceae bacterium]|nr:hypothetical protein [Phycisphaeraceae bacterium]